MSEITVPIKDVLNMIRSHAEGKHDEVKSLAVDLAIQLAKDGEEELSQYILAQYSLIPTWVPQ